MNLYAIQICITHKSIEWIPFPVCYAVCTVTHDIAFYSNSNHTLMKLATRIKWRITSFKNAAHWQLQTSLLSSKLSVCDDIVSECLYICNQNFDQRVHFNCATVSDEDWMLWNFYDKERDNTDISNQGPNFHDVHHVWVKSFSEQ